MAGQVCGQLSEIRPVAEILEDLYTGAQKRLAQMGELHI
jgi:enoyl-[acyl-carrier protein] reductase II